MKSKPQEIQVCVVSCGDAAAWPPTNATEFNAWLQTKLAEIPEQYLSSATVEFSASTYFDSVEKSLEICYWRPETEDEVVERESEEAQRIADKESDERAKLAKLLAKYGRS